MRTTTGGLFFTPSIHTAHSHPILSVHSQLAEGRLASFVAAPLSDENRDWWLVSEDPFQFFSVACDIVEAYQLENPEEHMSNAPVAQVRVLHFVITTTQTACFIPLNDSHFAD